MPGNEALAGMTDDVAALAEKLTEAQQLERVKRDAELIAEVIRRHKAGVDPIFARQHLERHSND